MFSPEGGDNEGRGENHLVQQKSMLLIAGRKKRENSLADCGEPEGREGMGGGQQSLHNRNGQTALTE